MIETGKLADLVILAANPLEDIQNTETVLQVMLNGRFYDAGTMNEIGNQRAPHEAWESSTESWPDAVAWLVVCDVSSAIERWRER